MKRITPFRKWLAAIGWNVPPTRAGDEARVDRPEAPLEERLITAWRAVENKKSQRDIDAAKTIFESAHSSSDPGTAEEGTAGLAAIASIMAGGGIDEHADELTGLHPFCRELRFNVYGLDEAHCGKWGFINSLGQVVVPPRWQSVHPETEGLIGVKRDGLWGFIDKTGGEVIPLRWEAVYWFRQGLAAVRENGKWGFIDRQGNIRLPPQWDETYAFHEGMATVTQDRKSGCIDRDGKLVIPLEWDNFPSVYEGLAWAKKNHQWRLLDREGTEVLAPFAPAEDGDQVSEFSEGMATMEHNGMTSLIDRRGKVVIPAEPGLSSIDRFSERLIQRKDVTGRTGYVDRTGRFVLPGRWQFAGRFRDGLAAVLRGDQWGMVDRSGQEVIPPIWDGISLQEGGLFQALQYLGEKAGGFDTAPGRMCYLDSTGKIIWNSDGKGVGAR